MTFGALGLLVLGMYAMTALITDKPRRKKTSAEEAPPEEALVTRVADVVLHLAAASNLPDAGAETAGDRERAAVAAVALALALEGDAPQFDVTPEDRYHAAAAAVAIAVAAASAGADGVPTSVNIATVPDAWDYHARAQQFTGRGRR